MGNKPRSSRGKAGKVTKEAIEEIRNGFAAFKGRYKGKAEFYSRMAKKHGLGIETVARIARRDDYAELDELDVRGAEGEVTPEKVCYIRRHTRHLFNRPVVPGEKGRAYEKLAQELALGKSTVAMVARGTIYSDVECPEHE